jgi:hypothetical protein
MSARSIDLDPADWFRAPWRKLPPLPRPEPPPFKAAACAARAARVTVGRQGILTPWAWDRADIPPVPSREEARFWLEAMTKAGMDAKPGELALYVERHPPQFDLALSEIKSRFQKKSRYLAPEIVAPLAVLLSLDDLVALMMSEALVGSWEMKHEAVVLQEHVQDCLVDGFARYVLPYLTPAEKSRVGSALQLDADPAHWPKMGHVTLTPVAWRLAALLGRSEEVLGLVSRLTPEQVSGHHRPPMRVAAHDLVFGLGSAKLMQQHMRRLELTLTTPGHVRAWLAHTEYGSLDFVRDSALGTKDRDAAEAIVETLGLVKAPEAAPVMLGLQVNSRAPAPARRWLNEQAAHAVAGLLPVVATKSPLTSAAVDYLREAKRKGHGALIEEGLKGLISDEAAKVRRELFGRGGAEPEPFAEGEPPWWQPAARESLGERPGKPPAWADAVRLPLLSLGDRRLSESQVGELVLALRKSSPIVPLPLLREVKRHFDAVALDAFAWRLCELWLAEDGPPDDKWAVYAVGLFGGDASALRLAPLIRDWPGKGLHQRAVWGLECLRAISSDTALLALHGIAQKVKYKALQGQARRFMNEIAAERGLSAQQLEDRIVPDLGLDERGSRTFDYGPRLFRLVFGPGLKPLLRDDSGKTMSSPPRPNAKDDPARAAAAGREWQLLKKQVSETVKVQVKRLERAMLSRRRWSAAEFGQFVVRHPFMIHLVRLVLWGDYAEDSTLTAAFRVTEDRTYADVNDTTYTPVAAAVGVVHPLEMTDEERAKWGEVFGDYEIIQPFPQLGRRIHKLQPGEEKRTELTRFGGPEVPVIIFNGILKSHDWMPNPLGGARYGLGHYKRFPEADLTAIIREGNGRGDTVKIESAFFVRGFPEDGGIADARKALRLGEVDAMVLSEVLGILAVLASKGS